MNNSSCNWRGRETSNFLGILYVLIFYLLWEFLLKKYGVKAYSISFPAWCNIPPAVDPKSVANRSEAEAFFLCLRHYPARYDWRNFMDAAAMLKRFGWTFKDFNLTDESAKGLIRLGYKIRAKRLWRNISRSRAFYDGNPGGRYNNRFFSDIEAFEKQVREAELTLEQLDINPEEADIVLGKPVSQQIFGS